MEAETGVMQLQTKDCWWLPEAGSGDGTDHPSEPPVETSPANTLILSCDFQNYESISFCWFKPPDCVHLLQEPWKTNTASLRLLIRPGHLPWVKRISKRPELGPHPEKLTAELRNQKTCTQLLHFKCHFFLMWSYLFNANPLYILKIHFWLHWGLHCAHGLFSCSSKQELLSSCVTQASHCNGFSCCKARALGCTGFCSCGSQA